MNRQKVMVTITRSDLTEAFADVTARFLDNMDKTGVFKDVDDDDIDMFLEGMIILTGTLNSQLIKKLFDDKEE